MGRHIDRKRAISELFRPDMCNKGQRKRATSGTLTGMETTYAKTVVTAVWVLGVSALGLAAGSHSPTAWATLAGVALLPPLIVLRFWLTPPQTMSERINSGRR